MKVVNQEGAATYGALLVVNKGRGDILDLASTNGIVMSVDTNGTMVASGDVIAGGDVKARNMPAIKYDQVRAGGNTILLSDGEAYTLIQVNVYPQTKGYLKFHGWVYGRFRGEVDGSTEYKIKLEVEPAVLLEEIVRGGTEPFDEATLIHVIPVDPGNGLYKLSVHCVSGQCLIWRAKLIVEFFPRSLD